ncbi:MAG: class I SAM-dependent methyltransferase [Dehalococcoidia bacterium]|jgi:SAM-dependent methyltransferase|nr:class I SAM-dependent methyltransferase [Dehalococcoidia bacterium]
MSMDYDAWAEWYDVFYSTAGVDDVEFYMDLAVLSGGPVLEIGCGTGRVSLPIAAAGVDVVGVDFSPAMLAKARERARETSDLGGSFEFVQGDMRTLSLGRQFPLVIIPARTLYLALTSEEQVESLRRAASHLGPGGLLAFNMFVPDSELVSDTAEFRVTMGEAINPVTGFRCVLSGVNRPDPIAQTIHNIQTVEELDDNGGVLRTVDLDVNIRYLFPSEVHVMLEQAGLVADQVFGDFNGGPLDEDSEEMVWVVRRADG